MLFRSNNKQPVNLITLENPKIYMFISIVILSLTGCLLFYLSKKKLYDNIWSILLLIGLMIYPGTLEHYGVLLLFIIYQFFDNRNLLSFNLYINIIIISIFYLLISFSLFSSICFLLIILIYKSLDHLIPNKANLIYSDKTKQSANFYTNPEGF